MMPITVLRFRRPNSRGPRWIAFGSLLEKPSRGSIRPLPVIELCVIPLNRPLSREAYFIDGVDIVL